MTWREAIETVLNDATDPMHYTDIAEEIAARKLRGGQLGATPANTVATVIVVSMRDEANDSPFVRMEAVLIEDWSHDKTANVATTLRLLNTCR
jgi:hypothetical protein